MRIRNLTWRQLEEYLRGDDRIVLPIGSTEQHAYLSLETDNTVAEEMAVEAADPVGVPVLPVLPFGHTPNFSAYPGSPSLSVATLSSVVTELLDSLYNQGFRRFFLNNGHSGNVAIEPRLTAWQEQHRESRVLFHTWFFSPAVRSTATRIDPHPSHANWLESFRLCRVPGVEPPAIRKPMVDLSSLTDGDGQAYREALGDGSYGSLYAVAPEDLDGVWLAAVREIRGLLVGDWESVN
jgi:creatinine amidohydrolase